MHRMSLIPLFLVSAAAVGYETALTRYFAVAKWSEYGYWIISIVMVGFALSGVAMALTRDWAVRHGRPMLAALPPLLVLSAALGYWATTGNPFNPLQLQNAATAWPQLVNIALYYAVLLPFFFLTGVFVSLSFVLNADRVGQVYGYDLTGAGLGAACVLALMWVLHPFHLVPAMLVVLAASSLFGPARWKVGGATAAALAAGLALIVLDPRATYNDFKAIYAPLNVPDSKQVAEIRTPRGLYVVLDDFTEVLDTDVSNNADMLGIASPPKPLLGLYRDGNRLAALPPAAGIDARYAPAALDAFPYQALPGARVLLGGGSGGFRIQQALALGAKHVDVVEPDPVLMRALRQGIGTSPPLPADARVRLVADSPVALARRGGRYDVIDLSGDFVDAGEANATAFSVEAIRAYLAALDPDGLVSIPISIREFPVYALRVLATVRQALLSAGVADPAKHVVVYRSAWNVRILLSNEPWTEARLKLLRAFCDARSFDVSFDPGRKPGERPTIYNDLPAVSFTSGQVTSSREGGEDAIADEAGPILRGEKVPSGDAFNLTPITLDRPSFYSVLRLGEVANILPRLELLPQAEIGQLVNLAVLAQALVIAALVLLLPLFAPRVAGSGRNMPLLRPILYFASLGLGFLFIEIVLIEKASFYLNDRTSAFALVLTGMLVFGGVGSMFAHRLDRQGNVLAAGTVLVWCALIGFGLEPAMLATLDLPWIARAALLLLVLAPVSLALGLPFPLGLARAGQAGGGFLPWAWALNGAFSVVATPLANLIAVQLGLSYVLSLAAMFYAVTYLAFPSVRKSPQWKPSPAI